MDEKLQIKFSRFKKFIAENGREGAIVAFSGGLDSATLAKISHNVLKDKAIAVTGISASYPQAESREVVETANQIGINHLFVTTFEMENQDYLNNPENRCYYCKGELLDVLTDLANQTGAGAIFDGTNASDLLGHRPGYMAIKERKNVYSPWVEAGITKEEIRQIARKLGLSFHDKPASPCLASRVPFGVRITPQKLDRIERAEVAIKDITGINELRVRDHGNLARIEISRNDRTRLSDESIMDEITSHLKRLGYIYVTMDLEGYRTGSMFESS